MTNCKSDKHISSYLFKRKTSNWILNITETLDDLYVYALLKRSSSVRIRNLNISTHGGLYLYTSIYLSIYIYIYIYTCMYMCVCVIIRWVFNSTGAMGIQTQSHQTHQIRASFRGRGLSKKGLRHDAHGKDHRHQQDNP